MSKTVSTYAQQLARWADSLAAGRSEALLADLASGCNEADVARYLENAMGERRRLLLEELSFVALAFADFEQRVDQYLSETPRRTYAVTERDQERFLEWLRRDELNAQQQDFVACQAAEYGCYRLAQKNRVAHLKFQRLASQREQRNETTNDQHKTILVNPVHVWSRLEVAATDEHGTHSGEVVFVVVDQEIRSLWLKAARQHAARKLTTKQQIPWAEWRNNHPQLTDDEISTLCRELIDGGLIVVC